MTPSKDSKNSQLDQEFLISRTVVDLYFYWENYFVIMISRLLPVTTLLIPYFTKISIKNIPIFVINCINVST